MVSTPQDVAFLDARKAIGLFQTVKVPITGIIENMSSFHLPRLPAGDPDLRPAAGSRPPPSAMGLPFLGEIPIDLAIRIGGDEGAPLVAGHPDSPQTKAFIEMARALTAEGRSESPAGVPGTIAARQAGDPVQEAEGAQVALVQPGGGEDLVLGVVAERGSRRCARPGSG